MLEMYEEGSPYEKMREHLVRIDPMKRMIGGIVTEAVLDTGAEVSLISMRRVGGMGVQWEECNNNGIINASGDVIVIVGKCVMEVELPIGKMVDVGFFVSRDRLREEDQVLLGNAALHAMGIGLVELPKEGGDECVVGNENKAIVGKNVIVGPGETGKITGETDGGVEYREIDMGDYKNKLVLMMERTVAEVGSRLEEERKKMSKRYDKRYRNNKMREPKVGDRVYVRRETEVGKLTIPWEGPYRVKKSNTTATERV
ncbi:hypothetical protein PENTCL1PPCAC_13206, partial [Pristionchus entomophagus]